MKINKSIMKISIIKREVTKIIGNFSFYAKLHLSL